MATRKDIICLPDDRLRQKSTKASPTSSTKLIKDMQDATLDWEDHRQHEFGVALAAVQIGVNKKVVVVREDLSDKKNREFITLINPKIIQKSGKPEVDFEGCLSVSDIYGKVPRYPKVKVGAIDEDGKDFRITATGFLARLLQHEIDHTNGIVFIDHIKHDPEAFYILTEEGKIEPLDYEQDIKNSNILWE